MSASTIIVAAKTRSSCAGSSSKARSTEALGSSALVEPMIASASTANVSAACAFQTIVDQILRADVIASGVVTAVDLVETKSLRSMRLTVRALF